VIGLLICLVTLTRSTLAKKTKNGPTASNIGTGLLPNFLSFSGTTRQNDLDITWLISLNPGGYSNQALSGGSATEHRQAFLTFGDKSWGSVKFGKDLGIFASDAILSDMTLLGVGSGSAGINGSAGTTTLGGIGAGYIYADWKEQIAYTTPNFNGFQATAGITQAYKATAAQSGLASTKVSATPAFEAKASYSFSADQVTGKVWVSGIAQRVNGVVGTDSSSITANGVDVGVNLNASGFGLTAYYYVGEGLGQSGFLTGGLTASGRERDASGGYVQGTFVVPGVGTKLGVAYGQTNNDAGAGDVASTFSGYEDERWTVGAYHPLTKSLNLVAEWNNNKAKTSTSSATTKVETDTVSLGAILFF